MLRRTSSWAPAGVLLCFNSGNSNPSTNQTDSRVAATDSSQVAQSGGATSRDNAVSTALAAGSKLNTGLDVSGSNNVTLNTGGPEIAALAGQFSSALAGVSGAASDTVSSALKDSLSTVANLKANQDSQGVSALQKTMLWGFAIVAALFGLFTLTQGRRAKS